MENLKNIIQKEVEKIWPQAKKNISKFNKDASRLLKKSEKDMEVISKKIKTGVDMLVGKAKREELYYELGKAVAAKLTADQLKNKNISRIHKEIRAISRSLKK